VVGPDPLRRGPRRRRPCRRRAAVTQRGDLINREVATAVLDTVTAELSDALADDHALRDRLLSRIPR
jgi:hypothetical protein